MFVVALHIARASAAATPRLGRQRRLTWRPHAGRRLDADDIGQVQSTDTGTEVTVCTIAASAKTIPGATPSAWAARI